MDAGLEWLVDAADCSPETLGDIEALRAVCAQIVADLQLQVVGRPVWHQFGGPGGVTGMLLLSESHLTCHTYPEYGLATFNLYCCRQRPQWPWQERLAELLGARSVTIQTVVRGTNLSGGVSTRQATMQQVAQ